MILKNIILFLSFFLVFQIGFTKDLNTYVNDTIENINFPIKLNLFVNLEDLNDVEIKNNFFNSKLRYEVRAQNNFSYDVLMAVADYNEITELVDLRFFENVTSKIGEPVQINDSINYLSYRSMYAQFDHNWNVRDYPFDNPKLKLQFTSVLDSSYVSLDPKENSYYSFSQKMENLKDGFLVNSISYKKDFVTSENDPHDDLENPRNKVLERLNFYINLDRSGSWLYLKLFLGSFLAFLISWLVYFIPKSDFSSRIELSVVQFLELWV